MEVNLTAYRHWSARFRWAWQHINRSKWGADVLVGIGVAFLAWVFLPDSVANGELIALGLGFGGAALAELVKFVMRLDKAPTEMLAEDYRELSRAYENITKELKQLRGERDDLQRQLLAQALEVYVDNVRADFESGDRPTIFVSIRNATEMPATNVSLIMCIDANKAKVDVTQMVIVPPKDFIETHHRIPFPVSQNELDKRTAILEVSGIIEYHDHKTPYCYRYHAWNGVRPTGVPMFVPCHFHQGGHITVRVGQAIEIDRAGTIRPVKGLKPSVPDTEARPDPESAGEHPET